MTDSGPSCTSSTDIQRLQATFIDPTRVETTVFGRTVAIRLWVTDWSSDDRTPHETDTIRGHARIQRGMTEAIVAGPYEARRTPEDDATLLVERLFSEACDACRREAISTGSGIEVVKDGRATSRGDECHSLFEYGRGEA